MGTCPLMSQPFIDEDKMSTKTKKVTRKITREEWLNKLAKLMAPAYKRLGHPLPVKLRISCGFTSSGARGQRIGECWMPNASDDQSFEIFIRPDQSTKQQVVSVLVHELIHAALGPKHKHDKTFGLMARGLGLEGPLTATNGGKGMWAWVEPLMKKVGDYPHARLNSGIRAPWKRIQPSAPQVNLRCPDCGYYAKTTLEFLAMGRLVCPLDELQLLTKQERKELGQ
jgi:hypothetical protein